MASELAAIVREYEGTDDGLVLTVEPAELGAFASAETSRRVLDLLNSIPSGVLAVNPSLREPVQTSTSLTTATTNEGVLTLGSMTRSSSAAALDGVLETMYALARLADAEIDVRRSYPPWEPDLGSDLLVTARQAQRRLFGSDPTLVVVHGGLECAVLGERLPGVQMLSIGPEMVGLHAPGEKVRISSAQRFYRLLGSLLDDLS
jgi:dipeptidase D